MLFQVAVVTVAFPATPLLLARARICISASHTREDLIKALEVIVLYILPAIWNLFACRFFFLDRHYFLVFPAFMITCTSSD